MAIVVSRSIVFGALLAVAGCGFAEDSLLPSLTGDPAPTPEAQAANEDAQPAKDAKTDTSATEPAARPLADTDLRPPLKLGAGSYAVPEVTGGASTGTQVGNKIQRMRDELKDLHASLAEYADRLGAIRESSGSSAQRYRGAVAAISGRLDIGTTPGNPILIDQWNRARAQLEAISTDISRMDALQRDVASLSSITTFLLESERATYTLPSAIDEDHRQLRILEAETAETLGIINRMRDAIAEDTPRQTAYVMGERAYLKALARAIDEGETVEPMPASRTKMASAATSAPAQREPIARILFGEQDVAYEQELFEVVSQTLEDRPDATFDLVAVARIPEAREEAARNQAAALANARRVLKSLTEMGLPLSRVRLKQTSSASASVNEVHLYAR